ncbi:MAG TPA: RNA methyltransferase [Chitinophagaceae bacterium]|nr:RNA methyltransferase [Chitinophagaceae bacterium]
MITKLQVKYIQSLGQKKFRDDAGEYVAEGPKIVNELLADAPGTIIRLYATAEWLASAGKLLTAITGEVVEVTDGELARLSFLQTAHQVLAVCRKPALQRVQAFSGLQLMLDGIQDPGNMGTIIRTADWFGISSIICSPDCADAFAPKVVQSTMGSIIRVAVLYTPLEQWVQTNPGIALYAAALNGTSIHAMQPVKEGVIVIGNESKGIHPALLAACQHRITIPRIGQAESLNAAVAAGITLSKLAAG